MGQRELDALVSQDMILEQQKDTTRRSLSFGMKQNPDEYAGAVKLGKDTGTSTDFALKYKNDLELKKRMQVFPMDSLVRETPRTAEFLSNPENAAIAHDDVESMSFIEKAIAKARDYSGAAVEGLVGKGAGSTLTGTGELYNVAVRNIDRLLDKVLPNSVMSALREPILPWYLDPAQVLIQPGKTLKATGEYVAPEKSRQGLDTDVISGIGQLSFQIGSYLVTGGGMSGTMLYAQGADVMADKTKDDKADPAMRDTAIIAGAAITKLTEQYGLDKILNRVPPEIKNRTLRFLADKAAAGGIEAAQEITEGLLHDLVRKITTNENAPILEGALREGSAAGLSAAIVRAALGVRGYRQAKQQEELIVALSEGGKNSKLLQRMPEKYQELVANITRDGDINNVFIPVGQFNTFFQSQDVDPAEAATRYGATNYSEAEALGTDVVIPIEKFAAEVAPRDDLQGLLPDVKFRQGDRTARERQQDLIDEKAREEELIASAQASVGEIQTPVLQQIKTDMEGQLIATGMERTTAEANAIQYAKVINSFAVSEGIDPLELHRQYGLGVTRPLPDVLTRDTRADINIDPILDTLRNGTVATDEQIFGKSLVEFVREQGGIQPTGELLDADYNNRPFQRNLVQKDGLTADQIAERAIEAGYFEGKTFGDITEADIYDALDEELRGGNLTLAPKNFNEQLLNQRDQYNQLGDYLNSLGIDLRAITDNNQVRQLIQQAAGAVGLQDQVNQFFNAIEGVNQNQDAALYQRVKNQPAGKEVPASVDAVSNVESAFEFAGTQSFPTNRDFKLALQARVIQAAKDAGVDLEEFSQGTEEYLVRIAMADGITALRTNANAVGWYNEKVTKALRLVSLIHPEISTDPQAKFAFVWAMAVTSNGLKVDKNFELAEQAYESWKNSNSDPTKRVMPIDIGIGTASNAINKSMGMYNTLIKKHGFQVVEQFMTTMQPAGEVQKFTGQKLNGENLTTMVYGAAALGPKIGNGFFMNLYGRFEQLTMDRWLMRTWGRWTGTLVEINQAQIKSKRSQLKDVIKALSPADKKAFEEIIKRKLTVGDIDAVGIAIWKASQKPANRVAMAKIGVFDNAGKAKIVEIMGEAKKGTDRVSFGDEMRKVGNALTKYLDGQKEAPSGPPERGNIRKVFGRVLTELQKTHPTLTMSDYQALLWYPEKRLYDAAKTADEATESYEDNEAPDYANAAEKLARAKGISESDIGATIDAVNAELQAANSAAGVRPGERGSGDRAAGQENTLYQSVDQPSTPVPLPRDQQGSYFESSAFADALQSIALPNGLVIQPNRNSYDNGFTGRANITDGENNVGHIDFNYNYETGEVTINKSELAESLRGKGIAKAAYQQINQTLIQSGLPPLSSDPNNLTQQAVNLWKSLVRDGLAYERTDGRNGYSFNAPQQLYQSVEQTLTPEFQAWFGDSKIVDENGNPLQVYHTGTFDSDVIQSSAESTRQGMQTNGIGSDNNGIYFSKSATYSASYGFNREGATTYPVYLSIQNPLYIRKEEDLTKLEKLKKVILDWVENRAIEKKKKRGEWSYVDDMKREIDPKTRSMYISESYMQELKDKGYDGIVNEVYNEIVVFDSTQIKSSIGNNGQFDPRNPSILKQGEGLSDKRGFIQFGAKRKFNIALLEKANLSTFLHETGHFYLEVMGDLAERPDASERIKDDYAKVLKYLGLTSRAELTLDGKAPDSAEYKRAVEAHEKFARSNEAYLMEGKAPSEELRSVFQKFKSWLNVIYKELSALNVNLTNEIREVFDRMYATEAEIEQAKNSVITVEMFATAADMGVSEAEFQAYKKAVEQTVETGKEALQAKLMKDLQREQAEWWKKAKAEMRAEVEVEVDLTPVYAAFKTLTEGKLEDGTPIRLNKESLVEKYGEQYLKRLPRSFGRIYTREGGMDTESAAEFLGFESGDALIEALAGMKPRNEYIKAEVDRRMRERYGDMLTDGSISEEAAIALHNSQRENALLIELKALRRKQREAAPFVQVERNRQRQERQASRAAIDVPPASAFRAAAQGLIDQMAVRDLNPFKYLQASRRASKEASSALISGDAQLAGDAKQREILNHFMYLEATKAKEEADAILKYAQRFEKGTTREQMGKAGADYLEQIDAILDRYEFRRVPLSKIDKRKSLSDWIDAQEAQGLEPNVDPRLLNEARSVNYREIPMGELRGIRDTVKNIEHLARLKNKLVSKRKEIEFKDAIAELVASAENNGQRRILPPDLSALTMREKAADKVSRLDAQLLKMEQIVEWLDGGRVDGPWHTYLWNDIAQAQSDENDLHRTLTAKIIESLEKMPKAQRKSMLDTYNIPGIGKVTRKYIVSMALNMGNQENIDKMMRGHDWSMSTIETALSKLSDEDWRFVQDTWNNINSLWPQIVELEKRMTGVAPKKVEAQPYTVRRNGQEVMTLEGGYFPLVYDPRFSEIGAKQETGNLSQMFEQGYVRATTSKGHTEARKEGFAAPLQLDFEQVLSQHTAKVIKDLTHREAIVAANKILTNPEIRKVLQETLGTAYEQQMLPWLRSVVNDKNGGAVQGLGDFSRFMMSLRANTVAAVMGFKATTAIMQISGLSASLDKVGKKDLAVEVAHFMRHPIEMTNTVRELSGEMRNRPQSLDRDIRGQLNMMIGNNSLLSDAQRFAFHGIAIADTMVTVPTWMAAYKAAIREGKSEEVAILEGDAAVRLTQGAGGAKDLSAVQRNNELMKALTMFYSYFNVLYNRMRDMGRDVQSIKDMPKFLSRAFFTVMIPAVMGDLIVGRGPDDEEDYPSWIARKVLMYPLMSIPLLRDIASSLESGYDYKFTPLASGLEKLYKLGKSVVKTVSDEKDMEWGSFAVKAAETIGYLAGVPGTAQVSATGKYLWRVSEGEEEADNFAELLFYAAMGKRKEQK